MTLPESFSPDRPFPGAHLQVPGAHSLSAPVVENTRMIPTAAACMNGDRQR